MRKKRVVGTVINGSHFWQAEMTLQEKKKKKKKKKTPFQSTLESIRAMRGNCLAKDKR